jgi:hypothetical protein
MNTFIRVVIAVVVPIAIIGTLHFISRKHDRLRNGFIRTFEKPPITEIFNVTLAGEGNYFAGNSDTCVYFSNSSDGGLYYCSCQQPKVAEIPIAKIKLFHGLIPALAVTGKSIFYYYLPGSSPLFRAALTDPGHVTDTENLGLYNGINTGLDPVIFIRRYDSVLGQNVIASARDHPGSSNRYVLKKQKDGIFSTDGFFIHDTRYGRLGYVYYYRNQAIILDAHLQTINLVTLIDTNTTAKVELDKVDDGITLSNLTRVVNRNACIHDSELYIISDLRSDNELDADFENNIVIDRYDIRKGAYLSSFYLPKHKSGKVHSFLLSGKFIWIMQENAMTLYKTQE